eukprot:6246400-Amphidinium_carterae.1
MPEGFQENSEKTGGKVGVDNTRESCWILPPPENRATVPISFIVLKIAQTSTIACTTAEHKQPEVSRMLFCWRCPAPAWPLIPSRACLHTSHRANCLATSNKEHNEIVHNFSARHKEAQGTLALATLSRTCAMQQHKLLQHMTFKKR